MTIVPAATRPPKSYFGGVRPRALAVSIVLTTVGGAIVLVGATFGWPLRDPVSLPFSPFGLDPRIAGVAFWIVLTVLATALNNKSEGHATFSMGNGPMLAAAILGGPAAAAWVAMLGTTEARELRGEVPWYGSLCDRANLVISWTAAALVYLGARSVIAAGSPVVDLGCALLAGVVAVGINSFVVVALGRFMTGQTFVDRTGVTLRTYAGIEIAVLSIAWLVARSYVEIAWWSPALFLLVAALAIRVANRDQSAWLLRHHPLTALPNAVALREHAEGLRGVSDVEPLVLYLDLDGFKAVNDERGHDVGDEVLKETGRRLRAACRPADLVAHLHGDEFVVLVSDPSGDAGGGSLAARLIAAIESPIEHPTGPIRVSASVGVAAMAETSLADTMRRADLAMARHKEQRYAEAGRERRRR